MYYPCGSRGVSEMFHDVGSAHRIGWEVPESLLHLMTEIISLEQLHLMLQVWEVPEIINPLIREKLFRIGSHLLWEVPGDFRNVIYVSGSARKRRKRWEVFEN